jgi:hypothetical protein
VPPATLASNHTVSLAPFTPACLAFAVAASNHGVITQTMAGSAAALKWTGMRSAFGNLAGVTTPRSTGVILVGRPQSFHWGPSCWWWTPRADPLAWA